MCWGPCIDSLCSYCLWCGWSVTGQRAASSSSHADRGGRCGITSLSSCLYRGSWICLSVGLSDSPPWRAEVCDREMERDGGWTGRVRADCLSVMNINGLRVSLSSSGSPSLETGVGRGCGMEVAHPPSLPLYVLADSYRTKKKTLSVTHTIIQMCFPTWFCCHCLWFCSARTDGTETLGSRKLHLLSKKLCYNRLCLYFLLL